MKSKVVWSKKSDDWSTPVDFYEELNKEFKFTDRVCKLHSEVDDLITDWVGNIYCNPPYSNIRPFLEKGIEEVKKGNAESVVYLIPSRTDTRWFHDLVYGKYEVRFIKGRLKFGDSKHNAPFPSMLVVIR